VHFSGASSIISFNAIVLLPRYPPSDVTILHSLSIIRLAAGLKIRQKQRNVWLQFSRKLKWKQLIRDPLVNKYKPDPLAMPCSHKTLAF
jgi:hypothetical protein